MTRSEQIITEINKNLFFKEFTFHKNTFKGQEGHLELADNILWLDDLFFIIQIKERNSTDIKTVDEENKWFKNTVLKTAKNQIKKSVDYFGTYDNIPIKNMRDHLFELTPPDLTQCNKLIIYMPNSDKISEQNRRVKIYHSKQVGAIHIFHLEDYYWICRYLLTPAELDEYLRFREGICSKHELVQQQYPEQYILAHYLTTYDDSTVNEKYLETLTKWNEDIVAFDISGMLNNFLERIRPEQQNGSLNYYKILKEIAKLNKMELIEFKSRFRTIIDHVNTNTFLLPYRFATPCTGCGFVFIALQEDKKPFWENALHNFTLMYKYKRKLNKCLGVVAYKTDQYFDINWAFMQSDWEFDGELEKEIQKENEFYQQSYVKQYKR
jgi:hypothetical protein